MPNVRIGIPRHKWQKLHQGVEVHNNMPIKRAEELPVEPAGQVFHGVLNNVFIDYAAPEMRLNPNDPPPRGPEINPNWFFRDLAEPAPIVENPRDVDYDPFDDDRGPDPEHDQFEVYIVEIVDVQNHNRRNVHSIHLTKEGADDMVDSEQDKWNPRVFQFERYKQKVME